MGAGLAAVATTGGVIASQRPARYRSGAATAGAHPNGVSKARPRRGGSLVFGTEAEEEGFSPTQSTLMESAELTPAGPRSRRWVD